MIYQHLYRHYKKRDSVSAGVIGAGHYGTAVITQSVGNPLLKIPVVADNNIKAARLAYTRAGIAESEVVECHDIGSALAAIEAGKYAVVKDPMILMELPLDVVVESTGIPEVGAKNALEAINHKKNVAMVNKETDSAVGPILKYLADQAGVVYTPVDGDQPGLLIFVSLPLWPMLRDWSRISRKLTSP